VIPSTSIFTNVINGYLPEPQASLLNGILFGINLKTSQEFYQQLKIVGLLHMVVLSGINITLLGSIVGIVTCRISKLISCLITILTIISFILFVGPQAPIVRAGFMGILTLVAIIFGKRNVALYSLFFSLILILIFKTDWIKTISLQLSYGATLGIILFGHTSSNEPKSILSKIKTAIWKEIKPSLAAQIFTTPLIFYHFKQISIIAPVSNLFVSFLVAPLMIFGFITAILGKINYSLGLPVSLICYGLLTYMVWIIKIFSSLPFVYFSF